jgi:FixJ family two-component response regulator
MIKRAVMIQASQDSTSNVGIRPLAVVLNGGGLNRACLPASAPLPIVAVDDWNAVFKKLSTFRPGCLIVDYDDRREQTLSALRRFAAEGIQFSTVGITADRSRRTLQQALRHGFIDLVPRPINDLHFADAVLEAAEADSNGQDSLCELRSRFGKLTPREREVLPYLLLGVPSRKLAGQFDVTYQTIDRHRKHVIEKMQVDNVTELALKLYRR